VSDDDPFDAFEAAGHAPRGATEIEAERFEVALGGYEGPLDLLLTLARTQKVDLAKISVLALAEQYLAFVAEAKRLRIELAADYLVMAAWLAWLKSRLLLPPPEPEEGPTGEALAEDLAFRLERLEAMRNAGAALMALDRLGRDVFARGMTETATIRRETRWQASLADLLRAYARLRTRDEYRPLRVDRDAILSLDEALAALRRIVGRVPDWQTLAAHLPEGWEHEPARRRSAMASSFAAMLELARRGEVELRQEDAFAPIWLRPRAGGEAER
jgi:segregation and condensation protein A